MTEPPCIPLTWKVGAVAAYAAILIALLVLAILKPQPAFIAILGTAVSVLALGLVGNATRKRWGPYWDRARKLGRKRQVPVTVVETNITI
jgi:uncharacterized membrane protein YdfJ with MMPL/SSD domain